MQKSLKSLRILHLTVLKINLFSIEPEAMSF